MQYFYNYYYFFFPINKSERTIKFSNKLYISTHIDIDIGIHITQKYVYI